MANLGFIGLGIMGKPMAVHLLKAGHRVFVYDLNPLPVHELSAKGAAACRSNKEVAEKSDIIILMLPDTPDVESALFGKEGVAEGVKKGSVVVDMSSISPIATKEFAKKLGEMGVEMLQVYYFSRPLSQEECTNFIVGLSAKDVQPQACCGISGTLPV